MKYFNITDSKRIEWNESATFNLQYKDGNNWVDYHCFTHYDVKNDEHALAIGIEESAYIDQGMIEELYGCLV
jgi:hypothetical protein